MCTVCGCAEGEVSIEGANHHHHDHHEHTHDHGHVHHHDDHTADAHIQTQGSDLHFGKGPAGTHVAGLSQNRMVQIEQDILGKNDSYAAVNRQRFAALSLFALNLVSSPGSGKTTLLTQTIEKLKGSRKLAVIEGDQQTANDADRIRATGAQAVQINTGKGCHLDAHMVGHALENLKDIQGGFLFIENVGNLVCPAAFDLGEAHKVAILSVTEGEDKPLKYPEMFHAADLMLLNKVDLLPHLDFDVDKCIAYAKQVNPNIQILQVSARSGEGMDAWLTWLETGRQQLIQQRIDTLQEEMNRVQEML
ncbi:MAG: hydrogenase nickel incorporation protein HypB [Pontibacterium sp.]